MADLDDDLRRMELATAPIEPDEHTSDADRQTWQALAGLVEASAPRGNNDALVKAIEREALKERRQVWRTAWTPVAQAAGAFVAAAVVIGVIVWSVPRPEVAAVEHVPARNWDPEFFALVEEVERQVDEVELADNARDEFVLIEHDLARLADSLADNAF